MTSRHYFYRNAKLLSRRFNIPLSLQYPRGSTSQWENETLRLRSIVAQQRERKLEEQRRVREQRHRDEKEQIIGDLIRWRQGGLVGAFTLKPQHVSFQELLPVIRDITLEYRITLTTNGKGYTLNGNTYLRLMDILGGVESKDETKSDQEFASEITPHTEIILNKVRESRTERKHGGFFPYLSLHSFDLSRQQIFRKEDEIKEGTKNNCLIHSLESANVDKKIIKKIKQSCMTRNIPQNKFKKICEDNKMRISIKHANNKTKYYGDKKYKAVKIGLLENHYFLIEKIPITKYAFTHDLEDRAIKNAKGDRDKTRHIDTFTAVSILIANRKKFLKSFNISKEILSTVHSNSASDFDELYAPSKNEYREIKPRNRTSEVKKRTVLTFDSETITEGELHVPFLCHYYNPLKPDKTYEFRGRKCMLEMLESLTDDNYLLYAHNASYDFNFVAPYLSRMSIINPNNSLMSCKGFFYNKRLKKKINIEIRDSYKLISKPLRDFGRCFKLDQAKEIMPYSLQTEKNISSRFIPISECAKAKELKKSEDYKLFMENCKKWSCIQFGNIDIVKYASVYCRIDCVVLSKGLEIFRGWMLEATKLDIYNVLTIPSLAHKYMVKMGCYDGVCEISSVSRSFIQKCLVGGRVMLANNKKIIREGKIADFDGVSLYPSSMQRLGDIGGFLKGTPKVWSPTVDLEKVDGYFVEVEITGLKHKQRFPLASKVENGIRTFTNDIIGQKLFIDKIALEDLVKFQGAEYKVIKGYYFNEGRNPKIKEVINFLFNERLKKKEQKNPIQEVYKLIMNAVYGKTLMKPITKETVILDSEKMKNKYVNFNFSMIDSFYKIHDSDKYLIKKLKAIDDHFNICHVGIEILSMSKRIMNEVMNLAEENDIEIFYQDTDSMHMNQCDIKPLTDAYRLKYNRELVGKSLGQFHDDFSLKGCAKPYSSLFVGLGKKCYLDKLHGTDSEGKEHTQYHLRLKGVPNSTVKYEAAKKFNSDFSKMYKHMFNGENVEFDLLEGGDRVRFKKYNNLSIGSIAEFKRNIQFT